MTDRINEHLTINDIARFGAPVSFNLACEATGGALPDGDPQTIDPECTNLDDHCKEAALDAVRQGNGEESWDGWRVDGTLPDGSVLLTRDFEELGSA